MLKRVFEKRTFGILYIQSVSRVVLIFQIFFLSSSIIAETIRTTTVLTDFHIHTTVVPFRILVRTTTTDLLTPVTASISLKSQLNFCLLIFEVNIFRSAFFVFNYFSPQFLNITKIEDSYTVQNYNPFLPIQFATSAFLWSG